MKKIIFTLVSFCFFIIKIGYFQTTFKFKGIGEWTNTTNQENENYPGTTIKSGEVVNINGSVTIPENISIIVKNGGELNFGLIEVNGSQDLADNKLFGALVIGKGAVVEMGFCDFLVSGKIQNNGTLEIVQNNLIINGTFENYEKFITAYNTVITVNGELITFQDSSITHDLSGPVNNLVLNNSFTNNGELMVLDITNNSNFTNNNLIGNSTTNRGSSFIENTQNSEFINRGVARSWIRNEGTFINMTIGTIKNYIRVY